MLRGFSAVILAGGENRRMKGVDKSGLVIDGKPILERIIQVLSGIFSEVLIVTNGKRGYSFKGVKVEEDLIKGAGPLGGIYTGLSYMRSEAGFFVACDMPFLHSGLICHLLRFFDRSGYDAVVPVKDGHIEPLHAIYKKSLEKEILSFLSERKEVCSIKDFLENANVCFLDLEGVPGVEKAFKNMNTPEDMSGT